MMIKGAANNSSASTCSAPAIASSLFIPSALPPTEAKARMESNSPPIPHGYDKRFDNLDYEFLAGNIKVKTKDEIIEEKNEEIERLKEEAKIKDQKIMYWYGRLRDLQKSAREVLGKPGVIRDLDRLSTEVNTGDDAKMYLPQMKEKEEG